MNKVTEAVKVLNEGGIIIFPTDTAYGIGCRIDNKKTVRRLFQIRKRPKKQAVPVLVNSIEMAQEYLKPLDNKVKKLMQDHWPGALTIVYKSKIEKVDSLVRGGGDSLGVRMPDSKIVLEIIKKIKAPIIGSSANFHTDATPYKFENLNPELVKLVDYVIPGKTKNINKTSTVIDCSGIEWKVLRQGAVKFRIESLEFRIMRTLIIDSSDSKEIVAGLKIGKKKHLIKHKTDSKKAQVILPMIDEILRKQSLKISDINSIEVNTGPGSFTGLRVGIAIANTLAFILNIPINGKKPGKLVEPYYK